MGPAGRVVGARDSRGDADGARGRGHGGFMGFESIIEISLRLEVDDL